MDNGASSADTHIAAIVEREDQGITQMPLQGMIFDVTLDTHDAHGIVDDLDGLLRAVDLGHDRNLLPFAVSVQVGTGAPGQVAAGFDAHLDIGERVADDLMVDNRLAAEPALRAGEIEDVLEGRAHHADAGRTYERRRPSEGPGHDGDAGPLGTDK